MKRLLSIHAFFASLIIMIVMLGISYLPDIFNQLDPIENVFSDLDFSDIYFTNLKSVEQHDSNIIIVNVAHDRAAIAEQLDTIAKYSPKVLGMDIYFIKYKDFLDDYKLYMSLQKFKNKVMASYFIDSATEEPTLFNPDKLRKSIYETTDYGQFLLTKMALEDDSINHAVPKKSEFKSSSGFINFSDIEVCRTIRNFKPFLKFNDSVYNSFAVEIAEKFRNGSTKNIYKRNNESEVINYTGNLSRFKVIDNDAILDSTLSKEFLREKIVLIGYLGENLTDSLSCHDKYFTPLNENYVGRSMPDMYGVVIHANIISMILNNDHITNLDYAIVVILAVILCYLNIIFFEFIRINYSFFYGGELKVFVLFESLIILFLSYLIIDLLNLKIEVMLIMVAIIIAPDISEIYYSFLNKFKKRNGVKL